MFVKVGSFTRINCLLVRLLSSLHIKLIYEKVVNIWFSDILKYELYCRPQWRSRAGVLWCSDRSGVVEQQRCDAARPGSNPSAVEKANSCYKNYTRCNDHTEPILCVCALPWWLFWTCCRKFNNLKRRTYDGTVPCKTQIWGRSSHKVYIHSANNISNINVLSLINMFFKHFLFTLLAIIFPVPDNLSVYYHAESKMKSP